MMATTGQIVAPDAPNTPVDVLPTWAPDGDLYFFRYEGIINDNRTIGFYRIASDQLLGDSDPELVYDLTETLNNSLALYNRTLRSSVLENAAIISPDGSQLAFVAHDSVNPDLDSNGVWLVNLTADQPPRQLADNNDFIMNNGLPSWTDETQLTLYYGLQWTREGSALLVASYQLGGGLVFPCHLLTSLRYRIRYASQLL